MGVLHWVQTEKDLQGCMHEREVNFNVFCVQNNTEVPAELSSFLDKDTFTKARLYALDKYAEIKFS